MNTVTTKFQNVCRPEEAVSIGEAVCAIRGLICFHVCVKQRYHKYDIKTSERGTSKSGYVCTFEVYIGINIASTDFSSAFIVICRLLIVKNRGHTMDR
jgi:hypothetical protein